MDKCTKRELRLLILRRKNPRIRFGSELGLLGGWVGGVIGLPFGGLAAFYPIIGVPLIIVFVVACLIAKTNGKSHAIQCDYFMCPWCRYSLVDLPANGICPECGVRYKQEICQALYRIAFQSRLNVKGKITERKEKWAWARAIRERDRSRDE